MTKAQDDVSPPSPKMLKERRELIKHLRRTSITRAYFRRSWREEEAAVDSEAVDDVEEEAGLPPNFDEIQRLIAADVQSATCGAGRRSGYDLRAAIRRSIPAEDEKAKAKDQIEIDRVDTGGRLDPTTNQPGRRRGRHSTGAAHRRA